MNKIAADKIMYNAFMDELEKTAVWPSILLRFAPQLKNIGSLAQMLKSPVGKRVLGWASQTRRMTTPQVAEKVHKIQQGTKAPSLGLKKVLEKAPSKRPLLGLSKAKPIYAQKLHGGIEKETFLGTFSPFRLLGEQGQILKSISYHKGKTPGVKGFGKGVKGLFKQRWKEGSVYKRTEMVDGKPMQLYYKRSPLGEVISKSERTGLLFGAPAFMTKTTPEGKPKSPAKRIGSGVVETVRWPLTWPGSVAKGFLYDLPKGILGSVN